MYGNFERCYATTRVYEGGKVNNAKDPGGKTNKGVTQNTFTAWLKRNGKVLRDVYTITDAETMQIYHDEYWTPASCDELPAGVDMIVFDTAINSGVQRAGILLQATLNANLPKEKQLVVDGVSGSKTLEAVKMYNHASMPALIDEYLNRRLAFLKAIRHKTTGALLWTTFGKGWGARVGNVRTVGKSMVIGSTKRVVPNQRIADLDTGAKAYDTGERSETTLSAETATQAAGVTAVGSGLVQTLQGTATTFQGLSDVAVFFKYAFIVLTVGLALYAIYTAYISRKRTAVLNGTATVTEAEAVAATVEGATSVVPA